MSKIFDALSATQNEVSDLLPALLETGSFQPANGRTLTVEPAHTPQSALPPEMAQILAEAALDESGTRSEAPVLPSETAAAPSASEALSIRRISISVSAKSPLLPFEKSPGIASEQYRILRTKISHHPKKPKLMIISSSSAGDGKSVTAVNLAAALSLTPDGRVLLLDADFRRPSIHTALGLSKTPGLGEVIIGTCQFEDAVLQVEQYPNLDILTNGESQINPSELLESDRWRTLCHSLRARYRYVVMDSPPIASVADCDLLQLVADGTILVVRPEHTKRATCLKVLETISKDKLIGVVLNYVKPWFLSPSDSSYGYQYAPKTPSGETQAVAKTE